MNRVSVRTTKIDGTDRYFVMDTGKVFSVTKLTPDLVAGCGFRLSKGKLLKPFKNGPVKSYEMVSLFYNKFGLKKQYMHRLVAEGFLDKPNGKTDVNHKDGNKLNNNLSNLEWVTKSENSRHAVLMGLLISKRHIPMSEYPKIKMYRLSGFSNKLIGDLYGKNSGYIWQIVNDKYPENVSGLYSEPKGV